MDLEASRLNYHQLDVFYPEGIPDQPGSFDEHLALTVLENSPVLEQLNFPKCPLKSASAQIRPDEVTVCPVGSCMFNQPMKSGAQAISLTKTKQVRICKWHDMAPASPEEWLEENELTDEAEKASQRIKAFLYVDRYVQYVCGRTLLDTKALASEELKDESRYLEWPFQKGEKGWAAIQKVLKVRSKSHR